MTTLQEKIDKRAGIWAQAQEFNARSERGDDMSAEDAAAWKRALDDVDRLGAEIDAATRTAKLDEKFAEIDARNADVPTGEARSTDEAQADAFDAFLRRGINGLTPDQRSVMEASQSDISQRAQGIATGGAGGYTVPPGFWDKVVETMKFYGSVLSVVEVINTDTGNPLQWPTNDDTANEGAILDENTQIGEQDLTFGTASLGAYTYTSKLIRASLQFLQDSSTNADAFIARKIGERLGRVHNRHFTVGTGTAQPQGLITGSTTGKTAASATAIIWEELVDLIHSVDVAYRSSNCGFMMHDLVLANIRKLKDGEGRPLWQPSIQVGQPDSILGYGLTINNHMASAIATGAKTVAFGNFQAGYVARFARQMELMRLSERYADYLQVGFFGFDRADGKVQDASAMKLLVQA